MLEKLNLELEEKFEILENYKEFCKTKVVGNNLLGKIITENFEQMPELMDEKINTLVTEVAFEVAEEFKKFYDWMGASKNTTFRIK